MMMKEEKTAVMLLLLVIVVLSVSTVLLESAGRESFAGQYTSESPEGALVIHEGVVEEVSSTRTGGHQILTVTGVKVFIPAEYVREGYPAIGETISVCGEVRIYQGEREIVPGSPGDIRTINRKQ